MIASRPWRDFLLAILLVGGAGLAVRELLPRWWLLRFDNRLLERTRFLGKAVRVQQGRVVGLPRGIEAPATDEPGLQTYWQVDAPGGQSLAASGALRGFRFPAVRPGEPASSWYHCLYLHRMRRASVAFPATARTEAFVLHYAQDHRLHQERLELLDTALGWGGGFLVAGLFLLTLWRRWRGAVREGRRPVPSILARLLVGLFVLVGGGMVLAGWASYALVEKGWIRQMDQALENRARGVLALCDRRDGMWRLDVAHLDTSIFRDPKSMQYFEVWDEAGKVVGRSSSLAHLDLPRLPVGKEVRYDWFHPAYLHRTRTATVAAMREGERLTVSFGQDYRGMKAQLRELRAILLEVWGGTLLLLALLLVLLVRISLRPFRRIAADLQDLDAGHLDRFRPIGVPAEARALVEALTSALGRLEEAFRRERTLLSNLAHELRTPLSGLRTTLEVGVGDDDAHARKAMRDSLGISLQMQGIIDSLLLLGRLDSGQLSPRLQPVSLRMRVQAAFPGMDMPPGPDVPVLADEGWLEMVLSNLHDNALRHARESEVRLEILLEDGRTTLVVANGGSDVEAIEVEKVFDRFWRKDRVRTLESHNAGLGLSLCRELVERMGGKLVATVPEPGRFEVRMTLDSAESAPFIFPSSSHRTAAT